ncbi:CapA family protein [Legionella tunisiensis]|uniref:CapA family protein n=1 Tax=Legionella tunisiensis TaxID=1034944 RepID=UPI0002EB3181|nr:CapA family protein [Legionella tunisiensis]
MASPYPWHYTLRWPLYYNWPSIRNHTHLESAPDQHQFLDAKPDDISLLFCGDIMVQPGDRIPELHHELCDLIHSVDLFIGNCESPLNSHHLNSHAKYRFVFNMPREYLAGILKQTGLSPAQCLLSMANNHTGDQTYQACLNTFDFLNDMGIIPLGRYEKKATCSCNRSQRIAAGFHCLD